MVDLSSIRDASVFAGLTASDLSKLGAIAREQPSAPGDRLIQRGDPAEMFYVVRDGRFALTIAMNAAGSKIEVPIEEKGRGAALGWSALVEPGTSIYSVYCTLPGAVISLPREAVLELMSSDAGLGYRFMTDLCQIVRSRASALQGLWIEEVEQSMTRVKYWQNKDLRS